MGSDPRRRTSRRRAGGPYRAVRRTISWWLVLLVLITPAGIGLAAASPGVPVSMGSSATAVLAAPGTGVTSGSITGPALDGCAIRPLGAPAAPAAHGKAVVPGSELLAAAGPYVPGADLSSPHWTDEGRATTSMALGVPGCRDPPGQDGTEVAEA
jgi:hypothetical protein